MLVINKAVINGVTINTTDFVNNSATLKYAGQDEKHVTLNHVIHWDRTCLFVNGELFVHGKKTYLDNTDTEFDSSMYAVPCLFYLNNTLIMSCDAMITTTYDKKERVTKVTIRGDVQ